MAASALVLVVIGAAVIVATRDGGGPGGEAAPDTAPTPEITAAPDPEAAARVAVLDAYRKSFEGFVAVASDRHATPEDPRLAAHTVGNALVARQAGIFRLRQDGQVFTGAVELHPVVVEIGGGVATVADCNIDRTSTVEIATGRILSPPATEGSAVTARLRLDGDGVWKQFEFKDERRSCVPGAP